ncbi:glycosyltransferase family 9 protein [Flaviaesturariibacter amylovorans]|uniref:Lipopolysaccharide heptosyltransferase II n=1 Tax=Flaviaesturariibacter amylovorans TaxID=1084520 RepID=A0ABP8GEN3_9BACT
MRILVRLPNWLGDMVMAVAFVEQLQATYPEAKISVIAKKGIHGLLPYFPPLEHQFIFDKGEQPGLRGLWRFGRHIKATAHFDLFFSLPDSLSAAIMGYATGAQHRIGYRNEGRSVLLTHTYTRPAGGHRVQEYLVLLERYAGSQLRNVQVRLNHSHPRRDHIVVNVNSEAQSRRLTVAKAIELVSELRRQVTEPLVLVGAPKEKEFIDAVYAGLPHQEGIDNAAGRTDLTGLIEVLASARALLTTDSGPAHLANALGTPTLVLFGAGNERNTAPFNAGWNTVVRLNQLSCEPCLKNRCVCFETPQCLERLSSPGIVQQLQQALR